MNTNECYVYFALDGDGFNPNEVTKFLDIEPTSIKLKGEKIPGILPKFSSWRLSTKKVVNEIIDVDEMAQEVINHIIGCEEKINTIKRNLNLTDRLEVVLWITTDDTQTTTAIGFDKKTNTCLSK